MSYIILYLQMKLRSSIFRKSLNYSEQYFTKVLHLATFQSPLYSCLLTVSQLQSDQTQVDTQPSWAKYDLSVFRLPIIHKNKQDVKQNFETSELSIERLKRQNKNHSIQKKEINEQKIKQQLQSLIDRYQIKIEADVRIQKVLVFPKDQSRSQHNQDNINKNQTQKQLVNKIQKGQKLRQDQNLEDGKLKKNVQWMIFVVGVCQRGKNKTVLFQDNHFASLITIFELNIDLISNEAKFSLIGKYNHSSKMIFSQNFSQSYEQKQITVLFQEQHLRYLGISRLLINSINSVYQPSIKLCEGAILKLESKLPLLKHLNQINGQNYKQRGLAQVQSFLIFQRYLTVLSKLRNGDMIILNYSLVNLNENNSLQSELIAFKRYQAAISIQNVNQTLISVFSNYSQSQAEPFATILNRRNLQTIYNYDPYTDHHELNNNLNFLYVSKSMHLFSISKNIFLKVIDQQGNILYRQKIFSIASSKCEIWSTYKNGIVFGVFDEIIVVGIDKEAQFDQQYHNEDQPNGGHQVYMAM